MTIETLVKRIKKADEKSKEIMQRGVQDYQNSIDNLKAVRELCKYAVMLLEKLRKEKVPFQEYEILLKKAENEE
jgi:hypothetical protein